MSTEIRGVVTRATGSWYDVLHEGRTIACRIRGRIRLKGVRSTNPVVVGDEVVCTEGGDGEWVIERILPRRNYIIRRASNLSKESHIIAANIDQALLVATLSQPVTAPEFLDRFLATCEAYKIPATILLAKYDLAAADPEAAAAFHATYESAGYRVVDLSTLDGTGLDAVRALVAGRTTLVAGNSGVGKSTLVGALEPGLALRTGSISESHRKGRHTTTFSAMYPPHGRRVPDRHPRHQGIRPDRHRRSRTVALLPRNDAHRGGLPLLQLHPHPRTGLCRARGGRTGRGGAVALRKLPENPRRR